MPREVPHDTAHLFVPFPSAAIPPAPFVSKHFHPRGDVKFESIVTVLPWESAFLPALGVTALVL